MKVFVRILILVSVFLQSMVTSPVNAAGSEDREAERKLICLAKWVCYKYKENVSECATAADFNRCIWIKSGGEDSSKTCELNGSIKTQDLEFIKNKDLFSSSLWTTCLDVIVELKLAPFGYVPSFSKQFQDYVNRNK